jgi:hypothetical protein
MLATRGSCYGVQVPFFAQPLFAVVPVAYRYTFCRPAKVPVKVSAICSVRSSPEVLKEEPAPSPRSMPCPHCRRGT